VVLKAVIFDMDGVLIDSEPIYYKLCSDFLRKSKAAMTKEEYYSYVGKPAAEFWNEMKKKYNLKENVEELININRKSYMNYLSSNDKEKPVEGVCEFIKELYDNNIRLALASSSSRDCIDMVLDKFKLKEYFHVIVSGDDVKEGKSTPYIFLYTAEKINVKPSECIVIEDSHNGVKSSKAAGMICLAFKNPSSGNQDVKLADLSITKFSEINYGKLCELCK
jgi:HAD superfamily hydrolase (TIGR01509 family)